jgi:5'-3' exonuclease
LIFDMSSVMWTCLKVGQDRENGQELPWPDELERKPAKINGWQYGYENMVNSVVATLNHFGRAPKDIVMAFDGANSKLLRQQVHKGYKEGRSHHPEEYVQFNLLRENITKTLRDLGAISASQPGMEADDVIGYLAKALPRSVVVTNDSDMLVLVDEGRCDVYRGGELNTSKYDYFPARHILTYKCLVGDTSDKIPGAVQFGETKWIDMIGKYGEEGLDIMLDLIKTQQLGRLFEDVKEFPPFQKIIDSAQSVYMSYDCARMYTELVNTGRRKLELQAGKVVPWTQGCDERLAHWYGQTYLAHRDNYEKLLGWMKPKVDESDWVSLDIEGSAPPESVEWLMAKKRSNSTEEDAAKIGVDIFGMKLAGGSLTFGKNQQYTVYFPVDHNETDGRYNVTSQQFRQAVEMVPMGTDIVVHNAGCELTVLLQEWAEAWADNGFEGMLPNMHDTAILASYENENESRALKMCSERLLGYQQTTYDEVTQGRRMNEMSATETLLYGADDTICTSALYNYYRFVLDIEGTWEIYKAVEVDCAYLNAKRYVQGVPISMERMLELERQDEIDSAAAGQLFRDFLIGRGWEGTQCPAYASAEELTSPVIKALVPTIAGDLPEAEAFKTNVRTPKKLAALVQRWAQDRGDVATETFGRLLENVLDGDSIAPLNEFIKARFTCNPVLNMDSPKQMSSLLYETLGLPVRLRNKATETMRLKGIRDGNPRTDDLALEFALAYDQDKGPEVISVVKAIQTLKTAATKKKMFYNPYRHVRHWKDQLVHADILQCATVTRRYASAGPNLQQLPKHPKHGVPPKFREIFIPHA